MQNFTLIAFRGRTFYLGSLLVYIFMRNWKTSSLFYLFVVFSSQVYLEGDVIYEKMKEKNSLEKKRKEEILPNKFENSIKKYN